MVSSTTGIQQYSKVYRLRKHLTHWRMRQTVGLIGMRNMEDRTIMKL